MPSHGPAFLLSRGPTFFFDFVDPASYLVGRILDDLGVADDVEWRGLEVQPPPAPLIDPGGSEWASYQSRVGESAEAMGVPMVAPAFVPWSRKAHELMEFAREKGRHHMVRRAVFRGHFVDGIDIGRVDLLAGIAAEAGLDGAEARAALGVDRLAAVVLATRALAEEIDVAGAPVLVCGSRRLNGLRSPSEVASWLDGGAPDRDTSDHPQE